MDYIPKRPRDGASDEPVWENDGVPEVPAVRIVLIHGAATTSGIWRAVIPFLGDFQVDCPNRRSTGDMDTEIADLHALCAGAVVVGVSGGATLGLELAARGVPMKAAVLHEPAAGSLAPGLLAHVAAGLARDGVAGFGTALYGSAWTPSDAPADDDAVRRDFAMFGKFEPSAPQPGSGRLLLTVGEFSPPSRFEAVQALSHKLGIPWRVLDGSGHAAHLEAPGALTELVRRHLRSAESY